MLGLKGRQYIAGGEALC